MATLHIVGAGPAGLSAGIAATESRRWQRIMLYEAAPVPGGRCAAFRDGEAGWCDRGAHLLLDANRATMALLDRTGGRRHLAEVGTGSFTLVDPEEPGRIEVRPGRFGIALTRDGRRLPVDLRDRLALLRLAVPPSDATVGGLLPPGRAPLGPIVAMLAEAVLNTPAPEASARLLGRVLRELALAGPAGWRAHVGVPTLAAALIDPAIAHLQAQGVTWMPGRRLKAVIMAGEHARELVFRDGVVALGPSDAAVLALPQQDAASLLPGLPTPGPASPILNLHWNVAGGQPGLVGLLGGAVHWIVRRPGLVSATLGFRREIEPELAWAEVRVAMPELPPRMPPVRAVREQRATPLQTPAEAAGRRAPPRFSNLALAGDWTEPDLPATVEAAVRSGRAALDRLGVKS